MDASQYKDYVLFIIFVSDKYAGVKFAPIEIPKGSTFQDMVALKGKPEIGDFVNKKIFAPIRDANKMADFANFNEMPEYLEFLINFWEGAQDDQR